jgi:MFS family permease
MEISVTASPTTSHPPTKSARLMVMTSIMFFGVVSISMVPAMPAIAKVFGGGGNGTAFAQTLLVAPAFCMMVGSPIAGRLSQLVGPRRLMMLSICLYILSGMFALVAPNGTSFLISRLLLGFANAQIAALALGLLGDFEAVSRAKLMGLAGMLSAIAAVLGVATCGWLTQAFGWRAGFVVFIWPVFLLPAAFWAMPARPEAVTEKNNWQDALVPLKAALPTYGLVSLLALMMFATTLEGPFILAERGLTNAADLGDILSVTCVLSALSAGSYGWFAARYDERLQLQFLFFAYLVAATLIFAGQGVTLAVAGIIVSGIACGVTLAILGTRLSFRLPHEQMTTGMGILISCFSISQLVEPSILFAIKRFLPITPFAVIAIICTVALVLTLFSPRGQSVPQKVVT